jgi:hypothetical protein
MLVDIDRNHANGFYKLQAVRVFIHSVYSLRSLESSQELNRQTNGTTAPDSDNVALADLRQLASMLRSRRHISEIKELLGINVFRGLRAGQIRVGCTTVPCLVVMISSRGQRVAKYAR